MEPKLTGFCVGCNGYSTELVPRVARNNNTGSITLGLFCPECLKRFKLFPYEDDRRPEKEVKRDDNINVP